MPNPYTYNRGISDAVKAVAEWAEGRGDESLAMAAEIVRKIVRLTRQERHRRTKAEIEEARPLAVVEAEAIEDAIEQCGGNMSEAARNLGIGRSTLYRKVRE